MNANYNNGRKIVIDLTVDTKTVIDLTVDESYASHSSSTSEHQPVSAPVPTDVNCKFPAIPASEEPLKRRLCMKKKVNYDDDAYFNTKYIYAKDKVPGLTN